MQHIRVTGNGDIELGDVGGAGRMILAVEGINGLATIAVKKKRTGSAVAAADAQYRNEHTQQDVAAGTAINADGLYSVPVLGPESVVLTVASFAAPFDLYQQPVVE
jgi:hypothetical protein